MRLDLLLLAGVFSATVGSAAWCAAQEQESSPESDRYRFAISVDMVSLALTVFDARGGLVTDLAPEDFRVYEDGVEQKIEVFSREDLPLRMVILLDTSSSMRMKMAMAQEAAVRFIQSLKPADRVKVIEFNDRVLTLEEFTSDFDRAAAVIRETKPQGATSLYNALYISLRSMSRRREGIERQAIVVLSDGADTHSLVSFEDVRELARKTDVIIYSISLRGSKEDLKKDKYANAKYVLDKLAEETGGSAFAPERIEDLAGVYDRIATELKSQYNIGYVSTNPKDDGGWRRLQVICDQSGAQVRTRLGYYAPRSAPRRSPER